MIFAVSAEKTRIISGQLKQKIEAMEGGGLGEETAALAVRRTPGKICHIVIVMDKKKNVQGI